jgi:hypothetical protein
MSEERRDRDVPQGLADTDEARRSPVEGGGQWH